MASITVPASSGSNGEPQSAMIDERKRKRMLSNRESARRSRIRKQKQLEDLTGEISQLNIAIGQLRQSINVKEQAYVQLESANDILRVQAMELTNRLRSLNSVLELVEEVSGLAVDIPEVPDPFLKPWQFPRAATLPVMASSDMFLY